MASQHAQAEILHRLRAQAATIPSAGLGHGDGWKELWEWKGMEGGCRDQAWQWGGLQHPGGMLAWLSMSHGPDPW